MLLGSYGYKSWLSTGLLSLSVIIALSVAQAYEYLRGYIYKPLSETSGINSSKRFCMTT